MGYHQPVHGGAAAGAGGSGGGGGGDHLHQHHHPRLHSPRISGGGSMTRRANSFKRGEIELQIGSPRSPAATASGAPRRVVVGVRGVRGRRRRGPPPPPPEPAAAAPVPPLQAAGVRRRGGRARAGDPGEEADWEPAVPRVLRRVPAPRRRQDLGGRLVRPPRRQGR